MQSAQRLAWILVVVGGLSALAAVFGPAKPWLGMDLGKVGAALFMLTLAATVWLFAARADQVFPEHMSLAERRAWVGLAFALVVVASFVRHLWAMSAHDLPPATFRDPMGRHFVQQLLPLMIAWTVISRLIGRHSRGVEVDERDLRLLDRAHQAGDLTLTLIVIGGIVVLAWAPAASLAWWLAPISLAYLLIGVLVAKALVEQVVLAFTYRANHV